MQLQTVPGTQYKTRDVPTRVYDFLNRHALFMSHKANNRKDGNSSIQARTKADEIDHNGISVFTNTHAPLNKLIYSFVLTAIYKQLTEHTDTTHAHTSILMVIFLVFTDQPMVSAVL